MGSSTGIYYHRVVGLTVCPCTTDEVGQEVEPFFVDPAWEGWWEVHHGKPKDTHDCRAGNLFTLWWLHHRHLAKQA